MSEVDETEKVEEIIPLGPCPSLDRPRPSKNLSYDIIANSLSKIGKVIDGGRYSYTKLDIQGKEITDIGAQLRQYPDIRNISFNSNRLDSLAQLKWLPNLQILSAQKNEITQMDIFDEKNKLEYLLTIDLSMNRISKILPIRLTHLRELKMNFNLITTASEFRGHPTLENLELIGNKLTTCEGINNMPELKSLFISKNQLITLKDLVNLPNLVKINARENQVKSFSDIGELPKLSYLNMRDTKIEKIGDMEGLLRLKELKQMGTQNTPLAEEIGDDMRKEILVLFHEFKLERLNKEEVTEDEIADAKEENKNRIIAAEEARKEAELKAQEEAEKGEEEGEEDEEA